MKLAMVKLINLGLRPFGAKIIRRSSVLCDMTSAIQRIVEHNVLINSVIDIGASDGKWSIETMKTFPRASFMAIEPLQERKDSLENLKKKFNNFDFILCAAGDVDDKQVTLNVTDNLDGSTVDATGGESRRVILKTIDAIASEKQMKGPFLLKFDTHGYEIPILNGAKETLKKTEIIIMEVYNFKITDHAIKFYEMCLYMEKIGFRCYDLVDPMYRIYDKAFWQMDLLFCRNDSNIFSYSQYK